MSGHSTDLGDKGACGTLWHDRRMKRKKKPRKSARRSAAQRPDEVFSAGPLQMARFGRHVVWQANWPPGEFDKFQARLVAGYDETVALGT